MRYCPNCKVSVRSNHTKCPLCQGTLMGEYEEEERIFPKIKKKVSKYILVRQIITFAAVLMIAVNVAINWIVTPDYWWSLFVAAGVGCTWVVVNVGIAKRRNLMKNVLWQLIIIEILLVVWDVVTGWHGWSLTYFLPLGILLAMATMVFLTLLQRLTSPEYMIYYLIVSILGFLPLIFLLLKMVNNRIPSIICVTISALLLAALLVFQKSAVFNEVAKKFHI